MRLNIVSFIFDDLSCVDIDSHSLLQMEKMNEDNCC